MAVEEIFRKWFGNASDTTGRAMTRHNVFQAMQEAVVEELKGAESLIESMKVANIKANEELDEAENCANELQDKNEELKEELEKLKAELKEYEKGARESALAFLKIGKTIDHLRTVNGKLKEEKKDAADRIFELRLEIDQLKAKNERLKNSFDEVFNQRNSIQSKNERLEDENGELMKLYMDALGHRAKLREALEKFAVMGQEGGDLNGEYHVLTSTGTEKYPVSEAVRVTKNILELVNHIAKEALKGGSDD